MRSHHMPRRRIFVSSTYLDLKDHRAHVINQIESAGFDIDPMEKWTADSDEPKKFSVERVSECDVCILLVGLRRGCVHHRRTSGQSIER